MRSSRFYVLLYLYLLKSRLFEKRQFQIAIELFNDRGNGYLLIPGRRILYFLYIRVYLKTNLTDIIRVLVYIDDM